MAGGEGKMGDSGWGGRQWQGGAGLITKSGDGTEEAGGLARVAIGDGPRTPRGVDPEGSSLVMGTGRSSAAGAGTGESTSTKVAPAGGRVGWKQSRQ